MSVNTLEVLNGSGHLTLKWNPKDPEDVENARKAVASLKAEGYTFFAVAGRPGRDEIEAGDGYLIVDRVSDPVVGVNPEVLPPEPSAPKKRGRPSKTKADASAPQADGKKYVAVRQMTGG